MNPTLSGTAGGVVLTVAGSGFSDSLQFTLANLTCGNVTIVSSTEARCTSPAHAATTADLVATSGAQTATLASAVVYADTVPAPTLSFVSPSSGSTTGATLVTLTGSGFQSGATVGFGGNACNSVSVNSSSSLTCLTPAKSAGASSVLITNPDAQSATLANGFTYLAVPTYSSLQSDILTTKCSGCHGGSGGLSFNTFATVTARVLAGNPGASLLYQRVISDSMPAGGPPLSAVEKQKIADWITAGAQNN